MAVHRSAPIDADAEATARGEFLRLFAAKLSKRPLRLEPGKFYEARNGGKWCCFRVDLTREEHCQADCVNTEGAGEVEYFYLDGRYDGSGNSSRTLVRECAP